VFNILSGPGALAAAGQSNCDLCLHILMLTPFCLNVNLVRIYSDWHDSPLFIGCFGLNVFQCSLRLLLITVVNFAAVNSVYSESVTVGPMGGYTEIKFRVCRFLHVHSRLI
jgi:hypothetical protein